MSTVDVSALRNGRGGDQAGTWVPAIRLHHILLVVIVQHAIPEGRSSENIVELLSAGLHLLYYMVGHLILTHVVAVDDEDASVLAAADKFVRIR